MKTTHFNNSLENVAMQISLSTRNTKCITGHYRYSIFSHECRAAEPMARGIHCPPPFFYHCCPTSVPLLWRLYDIHISVRVETVYELPLLPNILGMKHFYTNRERCEGFARYLWLECRPGSGLASMLQWTKLLQYPFKKEAVHPPVTSKCFSLSHFSTRPLLEI
jgi:hypothetical protein